MDEIFIIGGIRVKVTVKLLNVLGAILVAFILVIFTSNTIIHIFSIWLVTLVAIIVVRANILHPLCWFSFSFALYNTAYTICYSMGYDISAGYSSLNSLYTLVAMSIVLIIVGTKSVDENKEFTKIVKIDKFANDKIFMILAIVSILFSLMLFNSGYSGKTEMQQASSLIYKLGVHTVRWMMAFMVIQMCSYKCAVLRENIKYILFCLTACFFMGLSCGERDIIFRGVLLVILLLYYYNYIKNYHFAIVLPVGCFFMIGSVYIKYYFLTNTFNNNYLEKGNWLYLFLSTDFIPTGRNTQYLINNEWTNGYYGVKILFNELFKGIIPVFDFENVSYWYNYEVYPGSFKGQAFTLIGFGHIIGGIFGIIVIFIILGYYIRYIYKKSRTSIYWLSYYIFSIPIIIGSFRATINTIINISVKSALFVLVSSYIISKCKINIINIQDNS